MVRMYPKCCSFIQTIAAKKQLMWLWLRASSWFTSVFCALSVCVCVREIEGGCFAVKVRAWERVKCGALWSGMRMFHRYTTVNFYNPLSSSLSSSFSLSQAGVWHFNCSRCWILSLQTEQITCSLYMSHRSSNTYWLKRAFLWCFAG